MGGVTRRRTAKRGARSEIGSPELAPDAAATGFFPAHSLASPPFLPLSLYLSFISLSLCQILLPHPTNASKRTSETCTPYATTLTHTHTHTHTHADTHTCCHTHTRARTHI